MHVYTIVVLRKAHDAPGNKTVVVVFVSLFVLAVVVLFKSFGSTVISYDMHWKETFDRAWSKVGYQVSMGLHTWDHIYIYWIPVVFQSNQILSFDHFEAQPYHIARMIMGIHGSSSDVTEVGTCLT